MTDANVEQCDRVAAHAVVLRNLIAASGSELPWMREALADILEGKEDEHYMVLAFARHRQAAEKAQQERDAGIADAHRQARLEAAKNAHGRKVKAEARDHESMAIVAMHIATAIRSQGHE